MGKGPKDRHHSHEGEGAASLKFAFFLNLGFTVTEIVGGVLTNSMAIVADAVHDLGDSLSLGLAWFLDDYSARGSDRKYSYGYRRFSLLGALVTTVILLAGILFVVAKAVPRLMHPEPAQAGGMAILSVVGILVNGAALLRLQRGKSLNVRMVAWHFLEDVLSWVAVLVVSILLIFGNLFILDPILSILIALYVMVNVLKNLKKTLELFLQAVPGDIDLVDIERKLLAIDMVKSIHHLHAWSLDGDHNILTSHLVVDDRVSDAELVRIRKEIRRILDGLNFEHTAIEIGREGESCRMKEG